MLSIIIPVYNSEKYLASCVSSVLGQDYRDFELILVDDCSIDSSLSICQSFAASDSRVRVFHHGQNMGISETRYDGFINSKGDYISFIDNDDLLVQGAYSLMMADIAGCDMSVVASMTLNDEDAESLLSNLAGKACEKSECMTGLASYELLKSGRCEYGDIGGPWGKVFSRPVVEKALAITLAWRERLPWSFFEDCLFIPVCYPLAQKVSLHKFTGYLHRGGGLSCRKKPTPYLYGCIGAGNVVLDFYKERSFDRLYDLYIGQHLVYLQSIFYRTDLFEDDGEKRSRYIGLIEEAFARYRKDCLGSACTSLSVKLTVLLFACCRPLWKLLVGRLLLARKYGL
ncbi:MAG: glycosyltransferase family 2 protein [Treponema sp.]|nr:glycosyltransferase family 2 protein [Treponema sp.]